MPKYDFRLRFNLPHDSRIQSDESKFQLMTLETGQLLRLTSGIMNTPIKGHNQAAIVGSSFSSKEDATDAAKKSKYALLYWAIEQRVGIDFGDGIPRSMVTNAGLTFYEQQLGCHVRNDLLGIDVYEHQKDLKFISFNANAVLEKSSATFITTFSREYFNARPFSEKLRLAIELYASSFFDTSPRSRFITLVTSVEALLEPPGNPVEVQRLIDQFKTITDQSGIGTT